MGASGVVFALNRSALHVQGSLSLDGIFLPRVGVPEIVQLGHKEPNLRPISLLSVSSPKPGGKDEGFKEIIRVEDKQQKMEGGIGSRKESTAADATFVEPLTSGSNTMNMYCIRLLIRCHCSLRPP